MNSENGEYSQYNLEYSFKILLNVRILEKPTNLKTPFLW